MNFAYLLLGGNIGDRKAVIAKAIEMIHSSCGEIIKESSLYESAPWGFEANNQFINQVILVETSLSAEDLLENILNIELLLGRTRNNSANYSSRIIDIDILFYNEEIINVKNLKVPHPLLQERRFTLEPLNEIAQKMMHPVLNKSVAELLIDCKDNSIVTKYTS